MTRADFSAMTERLAILRYEAARLHKASMRAVDHDSESAQILALGAREAARMADEAQAVVLFAWATDGVER